MTKVKTAPAASEPDTATPTEVVAEQPITAATESDATATEPESESESEAKPAYDEAEIKAILQRNGLKKAWVLPGDNICFDEKHAKHVAGADFESLTLISAE